MESSILTKPECALCGDVGDAIGEMTYGKESGRAQGFRGMVGVFLRCRTCDLVWIGNPPEDYEEMYRSGEVYEGAYRERLSHDLKVARVRLSRMMKVCPDFRGPLLDVGCANGALVKACRDRLIKAYGLDIDEKIVGVASELVGGEGIFQGSGITFKPPKGLSLRTVTCLDTFEHFVDPVRAFRQMVGWLEPGGWLIIEFPEFRATMLGDGFFGWKHTRPLEHLFYFDYFHLERLARGAGVELVCIDRPIQGKAVHYFLRGELPMGEDTGKTPGTRG